MNRDDRVERFERDLTDVLREIAGEEAPMSLRYRLSDITERAPIGRRLWFATPMRLSVVAVTAAAVLALAVLFWPRTEVGPVPSDSPEPSPTQSVEPSPSASDESPPSVGPTSAPTVPPTVAPTPAPTAPASGEWTGLVWSDPVTPSSAVHLYDLVPWGDSFVAVGELPTGDGQSDGAFFTSSDGLTWAVTQRVSPGFGRIPHHLVALGSELFAFSQMEMDALPIGGQFGHVIWRSANGATWSEVDSPSWRDGWAGRWIGPMPDGWDQMQHPVESGLAEVAGGPDGIVAIGNSFRDGGMVPVLMHSTDGLTWTEASLPTGSDDAMLNAVVVQGDRFVVTGAVGVGPDVATAEAAAWYSDDGLAWSRAMVDDEGLVQQGVGTELGPLYAGEDGLLTCRGTREMAAGGWRYMMEWLSADGASWRPAVDLDENPGCSWAASDGQRIVALGPRAGAPPPWPGITSAWTSADGGDWQELALDQTLPDMLERFWVVPAGVIYAGEQSFWLGTAVIGP